MTQSQLQTSSESTVSENANARQRLITDKIAAMICLDLQPYRFVEDRGFRELMKAVEPHYKIPSRKSFSKEIIPKMYSRVVFDVKSELTTAVSLGITTDSWTSRANNRYVSYTAHFLSEEFQPKNYCLNVVNMDDSHTAQHLANSLSHCLSSWTTEEQQFGGIKIFVVADNAANFQAATGRLPQCQPLNCFAHSLQLVINGAIKNCLEIQSIVTKAKAITTHFKHNVQSSKKLLALEAQMGLPQLRLKQECPTRWNSTYEMLERLVVLKDAVSAMVASSSKLPTVTAAEWELATSCVSVLEPFTKATATLSSCAWPTISMVIPTLNELKHNLIQNKPSSSSLQIFKEHLMANIDQRWTNYEYNSVYAITTLLDPRFKDCGFEDDVASAQGRRKIITEMILHADQISSGKNALPLTSDSIENSMLGY